MNWVWVLSFSILGTQREHGEQARYESQAACQQALAEISQREAQRGRQVVGSCFLRQLSGKGWW